MGEKIFGDAWKDIYELGEVDRWKRLVYSINNRIKVRKDGRAWNCFTAPWVSFFRKVIIKMKKTLTTVAKTTIFFVGWAILAGLLPIPDSSNNAIWRFWAELIPFLCILALTIFFWLIEKKKVKLHIISSPVKNSVIGLVTGAAWLGGVTSVLMLSGIMEITEYNSISMFWLWILSVFINTVMQELLVRGYLYQMLKSNYNVFVATIVTTALFTFMHGGAFEAGIIPVMNVLTMSLLMTLALEYTQSLITPIIMHFIWNSVGAIVLGAVSLADDYPHLFVTEFTGTMLLSGGIPKMEGSVIVLLVNVIFIIGFTVFVKKKHH